MAVAKALREFAKGNPNLVVKGGLLGETLLDADGVKALADVAPREELLARLAGLMAAPMQRFAGLLQAVPRDFAYGLAALIDKAAPPALPSPPRSPTRPRPAPRPSTTAAARRAEADAAAAGRRPCRGTRCGRRPCRGTRRRRTTPAPAEAGDDTQES